MVYFDDKEVSVLRDMIDYYDSYSGEVPRECAELIGAIRFRVDSERIRDDKARVFETTDTDGGDD